MQLMKAYLFQTITLHGCTGGRIRRESVVYPSIHYMTNLYKKLPLAGTGRGLSSVYTKAVNEILRKFYMGAQTWIVRKVFH